MSRSTNRAVGLPQRRGGARDFLLLAVILAGNLCMTRPEAAPLICDPQEALNDQARTARVEQKFDRAEQIVRSVLRTRRDDFRANYTEALIQIDKAKGDRAQINQAIAKLVATAKTLDSQDAACAKAKNFYSILNSIGAEYYNVGNFAAAKQYFEMAYAQRDKLDSDSYAKLLDNLGLAAFNEQNYSCASVYFQKARDAGNAKAASHLSLTQNILKAAGVTPNCRKVD